MLESFKNVKKQSPLVHCMTNYVTVNDCANMILAVGGSPIMADEETEVQEIVSICGSLVLNIGTLQQRTIRSMKIAGEKARELELPIVLDPVGAGASTLRTTTTKDLMESLPISVIRGNISEIKAAASGFGATKGVDANENDIVTKDNVLETVAFAKQLSKETKAVIAISGAIDIVADETNACVIKNGVATLSKITGSGCMLTALIGAFCAANKTQVRNAVSTAVVLMGLAGEIAEQKRIEQNAGTASFRTFLMDAVSNMTIETLERGKKIEWF